METFELSTELIPFLPKELGLECLVRLHHSTLNLASGVCRQWRQLIQSREFYHARRKSGRTHKVVCFVQAPNDDMQKRSKWTRFGLTVFDPVDRKWERIDLVPEYPNGLPSYCQLVGCEGNLVVMGGLDPVSRKPVADVFVYNFNLRRWRKGKDLPLNMWFFGAAGSNSGHVYVAGGRDERGNKMKNGWVYDLVRDEWSELGQMSQERAMCEGLVIGDEFWVISGYINYCDFDDSADVYEFGSGQWRRVEGVWERRRCPRSNVRVGKDGRLSELDSVVPFRRCGVTLGEDRELLVGLMDRDASYGFYMVEMGEGGKVKLEKMNVLDEFYEHAQYACSVEI